MLKLSFLALVLTAAACGKKDSDKPATGSAGDKAVAADPVKPTEPGTDKPPAPADPPKPAAAGREVPNSGGLRVDAPAKWLDNGIGGAAGMHLDNDGGMFTLRELAAEETGKTFEQAKQDTQEYLFQKWISSDKTADGWKLVYEMDKIEMKGDEAKKVGTIVGFEVRRKIGDKPYVCSGSAQTKETALEAVELCTKVTGG